MESREHHQLVKILYNYVSSIASIESSLIESDIYEINGNVTHMAEGFVPDLYYNHNNITIIGEAKTEIDLEKEHSINQYKSYINHLDNKIKEGNKCILVMSVPWGTSVSAFKLLKRLINNNIILVVINELGEYKVYEKNNFEKRT